ncbi:MAG: hypothetical protein AB8B86_11335 [Pseudomonadales bacterium]
MSINPEYSISAKAQGTRFARNPANALYRLWAVLALFCYGSLELSPPMAAKYWLLLLSLGVIVSVLLTVVWLRNADEQSQGLAKPWVLHWSALLVVCSLAMFNVGTTGFNTLAVAQSLLLLSSLGLMTAGLYLRSSMLPAGIALAFCYLYHLLGAPWSGAMTGVVFAIALWRLTAT